MLEGSRAIRGLAARSNAMIPRSTFTFALAGSLVVFSVACSKESAAPPGASSAATASAASVPPVAPTLTRSMPMAGGLHVFWKLDGKPCDEIKLERRSSTEAYKVVATLPGTVDNKHDGTATKGTYTYRVRCMAAGVDSPYSAEMNAVAP